VSSFDEDLQEAKRARAGETIAADFKKKAFHCVFCHVLAPQGWEQTYQGGGGRHPIWRCRCTNCNADSWWLSFDRSSMAPGHMLYPRRTTAPLPHPEMPEEVRREYAEAASIVVISPRGAGALLRLALQKLMVELGEKSGDLNTDIGSLVKKGLDSDVQKALDSLRVIGNNAVHPLELDLSDDAETVGALFGLLNFIVEDRIARPQKLASLYDQLPKGAKQAIERRDGVTDES
jgi:hypothetical protein